MSSDLADLPAFSTLTPDQRQIVLEGMTRVPLEAGETLFLQGDPAARFFLLLEGRLKVTQLTEDGQQFIVRIVHPGELCGFGPAIGRTVFPGSAEAILPCHLLAWPRARWEPLIAAAPGIAVSAIQAVGRKLDEAHTRLREMSTEDAGQRVAHLLLRLSRQSTPGPGPVEIPFPLTRQDIAEMSGTTLHTVSRMMAAWEAEGLLLRARRKVIIADPAGLAAAAERRD